MKNAPLNGHETWFTIRTHEIDANKRLTIPALMMLMQEVSMHNALALQISIWDKEMNNLSWVILRKEITIKKYPTLGDKIRIITYPAGFQRIFAYRDFLVFDEDGNEIARASSTWTLMDLSVRKINKIPSHILSFEIPDRADCLPIPEVRLTMPDSLTKSYSYTIRHFDLDWNNHVNNIVLAKLMLQSIDRDVLNSQKLSRFTIHIKAECYLNEQIDILISEEDKLGFHKIIGEKDKVITIAVSEWV